MSLDDLLALEGGDVNEFAVEGGLEGDELAVLCLEVADGVAFLVLGTDSGLGATGDTGIAADLVEDLSVLGGCDGIGLGVLEGGEFLEGELGTGSGLEFGQLGFLEVCEEVLLGLTALVVAVLLGVHGEFIEFLVVLSALPAVLLHLLDEVGQGVLEQGVRVGIGELAALLGSQLLELGIDGAGDLAALAEDHAPHAVVHHDEAALALGDGQQVHEGDILDVLREGGDQWGITHARPDVGHFVEELDEDLVGGEFGFALRLQGVVDDAMDAGEVGHHGAHHAARQSASEEEGGHVFVARVDEVAEPVVDELLGEGACAHVGVHIYFFHLEALVLQHRLHGDDVGMHLAPAQGLDGGIDDVGTVVADFQDAGHGEARAAVAVVLDDDVGVLGLDGLGEGAQKCGLSDAGHVLETDFLRSGSDDLIGNLGVVLHGVYGGGGDAEGGLRRHACGLGPLHGGDDIADIIESAEDTGDVHALSVLHLILQFAHIVGHGVHAQCVEAAVEHVGLDAYLVEGLAESADGGVGVLAGEEVHLLEGATVSFYAVEDTHVDDGWCDALQLVLAGLELARALPHVAVDEAELDSFLHSDIINGANGANGGMMGIMGTLSTFQLFNLSTFQLFNLSTFNKAFSCHGCGLF